jgi:hypothetical protein
LSDKVRGLGLNESSSQPFHLELLKPTIRHAGCKFKYDQILICKDFLYKIGNWTSTGIRHCVA